MDPCDEINNVGIQRNMLVSKALRQQLRRQQAGVAKQMWLLERSINDIESLGTKVSLQETKLICYAVRKECEQRYKEDGEEANTIDRAIRKENGRLNIRINKMKRACGYEISDETIDTNTTTRSKEENDRRLEAEKDRRRAEEMDRITKNCMKSGIEARQELERAKGSSTTRGFSSYALVDNRVQEAVRKNDKDTEEMVQAAKRRLQKDRGSKREQERLTTEAIEIKEKEEIESHLRMCKQRCTGCQKRGRELDQCPCRRQKAEERSDSEESKERPERNEEKDREQQQQNRPRSRSGGRSGSRAEGSTEGRRRTNPKRINGTTGNAFPSFPKDKEMKKAIHQQIEEITGKDGPTILM